MKDIGSSDTSSYKDSIFPLREGGGGVDRSKESLGLGQVALCVWDLCVGSVHCLLCCAREAWKIEGMFIEGRFSVYRLQNFEVFKVLAYIKGDY